METLTIVSRMPYKVGVRLNSVDDSWDWCCNTLGTKQWGMMIGFLGESAATYCFANAEDATAFKLRFDL